MWEMHDGWGWWMMFGWIWMVAFWGLIIWAVYALVTRLSGPNDGSRRSARNALAILEERFARGEINREEFEEKRQVLSRGAGPAPP